MIDRALLGFTVSMGLFLGGCGGDGTTSTGTSGAGGTPGDTSGSTMTTTATAGTGGAMGTGGSPGTTTTSGGSTTGSGTTTGAGGGGTLGDHLLISEIGVAPAGGEFIEVYNPTAAAVDLTDYYLADNSGYFSIAQGKPWVPVTNNPGTDFLAQFPKGTMLAPGAVVVVATTAAAFETQFTKCPDFVLAAADFACKNGVAKAMLSPTNGGIGDASGLSNDREMVVLFHWAGVVNTPVEDVDYVTWGLVFEDATRVDKTGIAGYSADTLRASQKPAVAPPATQSIERCGPMLEQGEKSFGGNGITGHDETSEPLDTSFKAQIKPTPGVKNTCL
jgi:hypothetical protein